jgi:hypothetical protein
VTKLAAAVLGPWRAQSGAALRRAWRHDPPAYVTVRMDDVQRGGRYTRQAARRRMAGEAAHMMQRDAAGQNGRVKSPPWIWIPEPSALNCLRSF